MSAPDATLLDTWPRGFDLETTAAYTGATKRQLDLWDHRLKIVSPSINPAGRHDYRRRWSFTDLVALALVVTLDEGLGTRVGHFSRQGLVLALELAVHASDSWDHTVVLTPTGAELVRAGDGFGFIRATGVGAYTVIHVEPIAKSVLSKVNTHASSHV